MEPTHPKKGLFKKVRIALLSVILVAVALQAWFQKLEATDWEEPLHVVVFPIAGQQNDTVNNYLESLQVDSFEPLVAFFSEEAEHYDLPMAQPFVFHLGPVIESIPPSLPPSSNVLNTIWWSLTMRYWSFKHGRHSDAAPDIKMYAIYYKHIKGDVRENSVGLQKGMMGIVHAYADSRAAPKNNVIIAHETLHVVGATDKYDPQSRQPIFPEGFADPDQKPRFPQEMAEIMGARIPLSPRNSAMPPDLDHCLIGDQTALEILWMDE